MACYFGCATPRNRAAWIIFIILLVTGKVLIIVGRTSTSCNNDYNTCNSRCYYSSSACNSRCNREWNDCAAHYVKIIIAGVIILVAALISLSYFCCCALAPPKSDSKTQQPSAANANNGAPPAADVAWQRANASATESDVVGRRVVQAYPEYTYPAPPTGQPYPGYQPATTGQPYPVYPPPPPTDQAYPVHVPIPIEQPYPVYPPSTNGGQPYPVCPPAAAPTGSQPYLAYAAPDIPPQGPMYPPPNAQQQQGQSQQAALTPGYNQAQPAPLGPAAPPPI